MTNSKPKEIKDVKYQNKLMHESIETMDDDLALIVVLSGISNNPKKIIRSFSLASQLMTEREMKKESMTPYDKKLLETTTYTFASLFRNLDEPAN